MTYATVPLGPRERVGDAEIVERTAAFRALMERRRTVREFAPTPVPRAAVADAIAAAASAPSGANHQPWHFAAVSDPATKRAIRAAAEEEERAFYAERASEEWLRALEPLGTDPDKPFLEHAPWLIIPFMQRRGGPRAGDDLQNYYVHESMGIAVGFLIAALHGAGLATLTHTPNPMKFLTRICGRPADEKPFVILVVGHAAEGARVPEHALIKKPVEVVTTWL